MDTMPGSDRYAPPAAHVEDVDIRPQDGSPVLAERGTRLGAALVDTLVLLGVFGLLAWLTPWNVWRGNGGFAHTAMTALQAFAVFMLINGHGLVTRGQTWGKRWLGIRIAGADGAPVPAWRLLGVRYGVGSLFGLLPATQWIWSLADSLAIFHASRRCLHDRLARTIVVKA
jgi:uncharacterized RDD family membrane protein YckC